MNFTTKYGPGDVVCWLRRDLLTKGTEPCSACRGSGACEMHGETFQCPKCSGRKVTEVRRYGWHIAERFTVAHVRVATVIDMREDDDGDGLEIHYMNTTTGSGTLYEQSHVWPEADAQAECDRRNA